jgi:hypothetical protein
MERVSTRTERDPFRLVHPSASWDGVLCPAVGCGMGHAIEIEPMEQAAEEFADG